MGRTLSLAHLSLLDATPSELVRAAGEAGFRSVGLRLHPARPGEAPYPMHEGSPMLAETRALMNALDVKVHDVEVVRLSAGFEARRFEPMLAVAASLGARWLVVNGDDDDHARAAANLAALGEIAGVHGLSIGLEFMVYTAVPTLDAALRLVRETGRSNVHVLVDTLHFFRSGAAADRIARTPGIARGWAQFSDAPARRHPALSPGEEARAHRLLPGEGALPLADVLDAVAPDAVLSIEAPSAVRRHHLGMARRAELAYTTARRWLDAAARPQQEHAHALH